MRLLHLCVVLAHLPVARALPSSQPAGRLKQNESKHVAFIAAQVGRTVFFDGQLTQWTQSVQTATAALHQGKATNPRLGNCAANASYLNAIGCVSNAELREQPTLVLPTKHHQLLINSDSSMA